jgi:hypothetical protein
VALAAAVNMSNWTIVSQHFAGSFSEGVEYDDILPTLAQFVRLDINNTSCTFALLFSVREAEGVM